MMRFSLNGFNGSPWVDGGGDVAAWIKAAASAGFDAYSPDCSTLAAARERGLAPPAIARLMADQGIACDVIANCGMLDGSAQVLDGVRAAAADAHALGARFLQVNVGAPTAQARLDAVGAAAAAVDGSGLVLAIEYMPFTPLATLAETVEIAAAIGTAKAGALVDIWHHAHDQSGWETLATAPLDAIAYVEFDDALPPLGDNPVDETMHNRTFPGEGTLPCARFADALRERGYRGLVSIEVLNRAWRSRDLAEFARRCIDSSRPFWIG